MALIALSLPTPNQETVNDVNLPLYTGKWYVVASIPTILDKKWSQLVEHYTQESNGDFSMVTTYSKNGKRHSLRGKGFVDRTSGNSRWKVQYLWPFKADYWIIELADDYSYAVVGHPRKKFLYILSRTPEMKKELYDGIIMRCKRKGYNMNKLKTNQHL